MTVIVSLGFSLPRCEFVCGLSFEFALNSVWLGLGFDFRCFGYFGFSSLMFTAFVDFGVFGLVGSEFLWGLVLVGFLFVVFGFW